MGFGELSGKMHVLARILAQLHQRTDDRIVLVSNYTQTLDLFAQLCRERRYPFLRLDGSTSISKRQKLFNCFNDPSKASARVWRNGQKKRVCIYIFLSAGTIEEKVYQHQMSKEGLQKVIQQEHVDSERGNLISAEDLRDLFTFQDSVRSEIHEKMCCYHCKQDEIKFDYSNDGSPPEHEDIGGFASIARCLHNLKDHQKEVSKCNGIGFLGATYALLFTIFDLKVGTPKEEDSSAGDEVSFVFTNQVDGKLVPNESTIRPKATETDEHTNQTNLRKTLLQRTILSYKHDKTLPLITPGRDSKDNSFNSKPLQKPCSKLMRTLEGRFRAVRLKFPLVYTKQVSPAHLKDDDDYDFE